MLLQAPWEKLLHKDCISELCTGPALGLTFMMVFIDKQKYFSSAEMYGEMTQSFVLPSLLIQAVIRRAGEIMQSKKSCMEYHLSPIHSGFFSSVVSAATAIIS